MKRLLWMLFVGTRGGMNRARIIKELYNRPYNANQLAERLGLDYKTVRHHLRVLEKNGIVAPSGGSGLGTVYFLTGIMEENQDVFNDIWEQIKEDEQMDDDPNQVEVKEVGK